MEQEITYVSRSNFFDAIEPVIQNTKKDLLKGLLISITLDEKSGYSGNVLVEIIEANDVAFWSDWKGEDPTRFPARIKAVATVLKNKGLWGRFQVVHKDGNITIQAS